MFTDLTVFLNYEHLRIIWWVLLGVLMAGFAIMDGFDLGVLNLLPWVTKDDEERRLLLHSVEPVWEGNQVWFILGGGAVFAAWPLLYAVSFSAFYFAMLCVLLALIIRPVGFKFRSKLKNPAWRRCWDGALFLSGVIPSVVFGVAIGNVIEGVPYHFDSDLRIYSDVHFWSLFTPFSCLLGALSFCMLTLHGAVYLNLKLPEPILSRTTVVARVLPFLVLTLYGVASFYVAQMNGLSYLPVSGDIPSNPIHKIVEITQGHWHLSHPRLLWTSLCMVIFGAAGVFLLARRFQILAFISSAILIFGMVTTVGNGMYPFLLRSSTRTGDSLTIWDASSSQLTLLIMLVAVLIFFPIVLAYTAWVYRLLRGRISLGSIKY